MKGIFTREQLRALINEHGISTVSDINEMLKEVFAEVLQEALEAELETELGYKKHERTPVKEKNRRNGHSVKRVRSMHGEMELAVPRDREGDFEPQIVKKHQRDVSEIERKIMGLYAKGVSVREIQDHLHELYGVDVSPTMISNVTNRILPVIREWQSRPLHKTYALMFLDAIHYKVKQEGHIVSKAVYTVIGVDMGGCKDVLGLYVGENESAKFWMTVLGELKNRGVEDILICCMDNLSGFSEAISACFPRTEIQKCVVHQIRNSIKYVSHKDVKPLLADLKTVYTAPSEGAGYAALDAFDGVWGKQYPLVVRSWRSNWAELATFFKYPPELRKLMYTTNMIESYHRQLRKVTKGKGAFTSDEALLKMLFLATQDVMRKWTMRIHNWGQILLQLEVFFSDRVQSYLG